MLIAALPVFVRVVARTDESPSLIPPKDNEDGLKLAIGACPVPLRVALSGLVEAFVENVRLAVREPTAVGVKVTLTTQLLPAERVGPQVLFEMA